jgi:hypothetical protein
MPSFDELADALYDLNVGATDNAEVSQADLRTLAREAAKQALLEMADEYAEFAEHEFEVPHASEMILARAERIGEETDG